MKDKFNLVGTKIQNFNLPNSRGETVSIKSLEGKNIVLILFRNID
jgi:peroxiredoxin